MFPEFQQRLVTFAERDTQVREPFLELLAADTLNVARAAEPARLVPDRALATFLGVGAASLCVLVWMILAGPGYLGHGAALLWAATPRGGSAAHAPAGGSHRLSIRFRGPSRKCRILRRGRTAAFAPLQYSCAGPPGREECPRDVPLSRVDPDAECCRGTRRRSPRRRRHGCRP